MRDVKRVLEMRSQNHSQRDIARATKVSRDTVRKIFNAADSKKICWSSIQDLSEYDVQKLLFEEEVKINLSIKQPDFDYVHKELLKPGTTIKLLWEEYADACRSINVPFYQYSYFCERYRDHVKKHNLTMHINHKPGDKMMVDWNGTCMYIYDRYTGERITAYLFEATLPFSMCSFVRACPSMKIGDWLDCHIHAFRYFEGVTRLLVPDNLKTGVISNRKYEDPVLNKSYQEMADHYDTTILPTRVRRPKDKAAVEGAVGDCTIAIVGKLRNRKFFSFEELNEAILKELDTFNSKPFQKKEGYKMNQVCSHDRLYGRINQYSTNESHMPENHQRFLWNKDRFIRWAASIGESTMTVVQKLFNRYKVEEQAYKGCMSLLKLSDKYGKTRLEDACQLALEHISQPSYRNIRMILQSNQDRKKKTQNSQKETVEYAFVRGKDYYGGKRNG